MGHIRLGVIPKTRKWSDLVERVAGARPETAVAAATAERDVQQIASKALDAAQQGLAKAKNDPAVSFTFYLLTQVALASRTPDWKERLRALGITLSDESSVFDLTAELQTAVDDHVTRAAAGSTDLGEMARQAAGEAIAALAGSQVSLFGSSAADVQTALRSLSTKKGFGELGQAFFGRFVARFLNFYLSRITAAGLGTARLQQLGDVARFNDTLRHHCEQSALIVRDFCGEWYSKTEYQEGIDVENASRFVAVALQKLQSELAQQRADT